MLGEPVGLDGTRGEAAERVRRFGKKLETATKLPVELIEEALTSVEADERLREAGVDTRKDRARIDAVAAQILLQDALDRRARTTRTRGDEAWRRARRAPAARSRRGGPAKEAEPGGGPFWACSFSSSCSWCRPWACSAGRG